MANITNREEKIIKLLERIASNLKLLNKESETSVADVGAIGAGGISVYDLIKTGGKVSGTTAASAILALDGILTYGINQRQAQSVDLSILKSIDLKNLENLTDEDFNKLVEYIEEITEKIVKWQDDLIFITEQSKDKIRNPILNLPKRFLEALTGKDTSPARAKIDEANNIRFFNASYKREINDIIKKINNLPSSNILDEVIVYPKKETKKKAGVINKAESENNNSVSGLKKDFKLDEELENYSQKIFEEFSKKIEKDSAERISKLTVDIIPKISEENITNIKRMLDELQALYEFLKSDKEITDKEVETFGISKDGLERLRKNSDDVKDVIDQIIGKKKELANNSEFQTFSDSIKEGIERIGYGGQKDIGQGILQIGGATEKFLPTVQKFADDLGTIFGGENGFGKNTQTDIQNTIKALGAVAEVGQGVGKIMSGDIGGGITSAVSGVAKLIGHSKQVNKEHREALRLLELQRVQQSHMYELAVLSKDLKYEKGTTIFGTDGWGKASNAARNYQKSVQSLNQSMDELEKVTIKNGSKKSGWGPWKKRKDIYDGILKVYPELIDEEGKFNKELAKSVLSTRTMSDENKARLQSAIDYAEAVESAYATMKDYLTSIFGGMGDGILDAFVKAFEGGSDAMDKFYESASDMLEHLIRDFIFSLRIAPLIEDASESAMKAMEDQSLSEEEKNKQVADITANLIDNLVDAQDDVFGDLEFYRKYMNEKHGLDVFGPESSSTQGSKGSFQTMSQETGNELNGRFTALQMSGANIEQHMFTASADIKNILTQTFLISSTVQEQLNIQDEIRNIQLNSLFELKDINNNTKELYAINEGIQVIKENTSRL